MADERTRKRNRASRRDSDTALHSLTTKLRQLRNRADVSTEELAAAMRELGFPWTTTTVGDIERDPPRRLVWLSELFGLAYVYDVPVALLLAPGDDGGALGMLGLPATFEVAGIAGDRDLLRRLLVGEHGWIDSRVSEHGDGYRPAPFTTAIATRLRENPWTASPEDRDSWVRLLLEYEHDPADPENADRWTWQGRPLTSLEAWLVEHPTADVVTAFREVADIKLQNLELEQRLALERRDNLLGRAEGRASSERAE